MTRIALIHTTGSSPYFPPKCSFTPLLCLLLVLRLLLLGPVIVEDHAERAREHYDEVAVGDRADCVGVGLDVDIDDAMLLEFCAYAI